MQVHAILANSTISSNFHHHLSNYNLNLVKNRRISVTFFLSFSISSVFTKRSKSTMITSSSSSSSSHGSGAFKTLAERVTFEKEIKKSKFIAIAAPVYKEQSANSFLSEIGDQYRCSDDGEPSSTAGKPIYSAIASSGIDRVMVVVIRYFGGIKLGTGGLVRAYGGVTSECLKNATTCLVKSKVPMGVEVSFDLLGLLYHQLQSFQAADVKQDYETGKDDTTMVTFKMDFDKVDSLEDAVKASCGRDIVFFKH
ncbi:uncharacterized protein LOC104895499 isoform X2 [Beta vulgaris subsp. vulgaris]|uniref:uncharacterized protein LOC104895499 isoform X2 n=1 Tax=Beta vulgaris subsp. vulgaris TaxID=3555 RepID=UPI000900F014|nr:uncharacterized protein LOC104895499 isoform X2 [Beta vulgaris subsp. vulgaris]